MGGQSVGRKRGSPSALTREFDCAVILFGARSVQRNGLPDDFLDGRRKLLRTRVEERGGRVVETISPEVTHVIASVTSSSPPGNLPPNLPIHTPEWICDALIHHRLPPSNAFLWTPFVGNTTPTTTPSTAAPSASISSTAPRKRHRSGVDESKFACQPSASSPAVMDHNPLITDMLERLADCCDALDDPFRKMRYKAARDLVRSLDVHLASEADVDAHLKLLSSKGNKSSSVVDRVKEMVRTGRCAKLDELESSELVRCLRLFMTVWGVGRKMAQALYAAGARTIEDVRDKQAMLSEPARKALRWYDDLLARIPREEVTRLGDRVKRAMEERCARFEMVICGSYRRGQQTCGDIDVLILPDDDELDCYALLMNLVSDLKRAGFLTDDLAMPSGKSECGAASYMGIAKLDGSDSLHRHMDIKIYPKALKPFALTYFSGSEYFVRSMRLFAKLRGYKLCDHGLYRHGGGDKTGGTPASIPCATEQDVFKALGLQWVAREDRGDVHAAIAMRKRP